MWFAECSCADHRLTGNCAEGSGKCECRPEYMAPNCDTCTYGYFGYPNCRPCDCNLNGTRGYYCEAVSGHCPCLSNFGGPLCRECSPGYFGYPECSGMSAPFIYEIMALDFNKQWCSSFT